jgi:methyl-accepting chemotaxis protein
MRDWFLNPTIRTKVKLILGLLLVVIIGAAGLTYQRLTAMTENALSIKGQMLPATRTLARMADLAEFFRLLEAEAIFTVAPADMNRLQSQMTATDQEMTELIAKLEPQLPPASRGLLATLRTAWAGFARTGPQIWQFSTDNQDVYARRTYQKDAAALYESVLDAMHKLNEANVGDGDRVAETSVETAQGTETVLGVMIALTLLGGLLALLFMNRAVIDPMLATAAAIDRLANEDLSIEIAGTERRDEIGVLAQSAAVLRDHALAKRMLEREQREAHEKQAIRQKRVGDAILAFEKAFQYTLSVLTAASSQLHETAGGLSQSASQTSDRASTVAAAAEQTTSNVQSVARSIEAMATAITEIGRQVTQSSQIAGHAVEEAARTNVAIRGLSEAAQHIGAIIQLIQKISSQTNLLALNATIEAARAGSAGKGFAVVASEVKALASETARATEEIAGQVATMQAATGEAVAAIRGIDRTISQINEISSTVASAVEQQGTATHQITRNTQEAARGTRDVSDNVVVVHQAASTTGIGAAQVLSSSSELADQTTRLRRELDRFLADLRAA